MVVRQGVGGRGGQRRSGGFRHGAGHQQIWFRHRQSRYHASVEHVHQRWVLASISNRVIVAGTTLLITNSATDAEAPPQTLTYSLISPPSPPAGVAINPSNGLFSWRPLIAQSATTNLLNVQVADSGAVSLSA